MDRRSLLQGGLSAGLLGLPAVARAQANAPLNLIPIRVDTPAVFRTTVCLRPFRAVGPRIEAEALGRKTVVHNYGHGGSGWSLSWGSATEAVRLAMQPSPPKVGPRKIGVIGAGALGLTAAITAQRAGAEVTIYARERFPYVRSARATGLWTPDSRIAKTASVAPDFGDRWERMARTALTMHESFVSLPGNPVEWIDNYQCRKAPRVLAPGETPPPPSLEDEDPGFVELRGRLSDVQPHSVEIPAGSHPFNAAIVRRNAQLSFNVADYSHQLESDFLAAGGRFEAADFKAPADLLKLKESVLINCTGYGARALWHDDSVVPVRGQIVWLAPQEGVHYAIGYGSMGVIARRDGIVVQEYGPNDNFGFGDDNETVDTAAAQAAVDRLKSIYA